MKKFEQILKDIRKMYAKKEEAEAKQEQLLDSFYAPLKSDDPKSRFEFLKENHEKKKVIDEEVRKYAEISLDCRLSVKLLQNNAKVALFHEVMPTVLEVFRKYSGKQYGEKTEKAIREEILSLTGCWCFVSCQYGCGEFRIEHKESNYKFVCGVQVVNGERKPLLENNRICPLEMDDLKIWYTKPDYIENIKKAVSDLKKYRREAVKKQEELRKACELFNGLTVDGIESLNYASHIYPTF